MATDTLRQKQLFEAIHDRYTASTTDGYARAYRDEFLFPWILDRLGPAESLIEIASGTGLGAGWMRAHRPGLDIAGCDISESAARDFAAIHGRPCYLWDMTKPIVADRTFDVVLVQGGIHHLVADLDTAFANIDRLLRPGGRLIMAEPNADYILEPIRRLWYRLDTRTFDAANEHALSHARLAAAFGDRFRPVDVRYFGGPAYYLLLLNFVLRVPGSAKRWLAPALMRLERLFHRLPGPWPFASFVACWEKR